MRKSVARELCCFKEARVDFTREDTLSCLREERGCKDLAHSRAQSVHQGTHGNAHKLNFLSHRLLIDRVIDCQ